MAGPCVIIWKNINELPSGTMRWWGRWLWWLRGWTAWRGPLLLELKKMWIWNFFLSCKSLCEFKNINSCVYVSIYGFSRFFFSHLILGKIFATFVAILHCSRAHFWSTFIRIPPAVELRVGSYTGCRFTRGYEALVWDCVTLEVGWACWRLDESVRVWISLCDFEWLC